jgi:hypothetical protein
VYCTNLKYIIIIAFITHLLIDFHVIFIFNTYAIVESILILSNKNDTFFDTSMPEQIFSFIAVILINLISLFFSYLPK